MQLLSKTNSVCPECLVQVPAEYIAEGDNVFLQKECSRHGVFKTLVWEGVAHFLEWSRPPKETRTLHPQTQTQKGCPFDCGICPEHRQETCCVLLEVTQECNMHCPVCFAQSGGQAPPPPTLAEISAWYDMLLAHGGPFNIQLSGGEPTMRDDLPEIIQMGKEKGFDFFQLNTNGLRIGTDISYLKALKEAGLTTVFLQFDGLRDETQRVLRGENKLAVKQQAIENCATLQIGVVLVPVLVKGLNDGEIGAILEYAFSRLPVVRGVHFQPVSLFGRTGQGVSQESRLTLPGVLKEIEAQTKGQIALHDFSPGGAEHPLCSFHGDFIRENGHIRPLRKKQNDNAGCCCSSQQARQVVAKKWAAPAAGLSLSQPMDAFDLFLHKKETQVLAISGMAFQDAYTLDLARVRQCYIHEVSPDGKRVPFCTYNLTSNKGQSLYRPGGAGPLQE